MLVAVPYAQAYASDMHTARCHGLTVTFPALPVELRRPLWLREDERCAVLVGTRYLNHYRVHRFVMVENEHNYPDRAFQITMEQVRTIPLEPGERLLGAVHTHPHPYRHPPSLTDIRTLRRPDSLGGVVKRGVVHWYTRTRNAKNPRPKPGVLRSR